MKDFSQLIIEPNKWENADTNEVVGVLLASACLAFACQPLIGAAGEGMSKYFDHVFGDKQNTNTETPKNTKNSNTETQSTKKDNDNENGVDAEAFNTLLFMAKESNQKEKDANIQKKNDAMIKLLISCSFDKNGNEIPLEERINKMKDVMSPEQFDQFKKEMTETYEKNKNNKEFKESLAKAKANFNPEKYEKMLKAAKSEAKTVIRAIEKEQKELEDYEKKLQELEDSVNNTDKKDVEIRDLKKQLEEMKKNPPKTMTSVATGVKATSTKKKTEEPKKKTEEPKKKTEEPKKKTEEPKKEGKYEVKDEEVKDPKTGKNIKVKTYTGPRGGKFYYPEGVPKTKKHKVYVESISLQDYLLESIE